MHHIKPLKENHWCAPIKRTDNHQTAAKIGSEIPVGSRPMRWKKLSTMYDNVDLLDRFDQSQRKEYFE